MCASSGSAGRAISNHLSLPRQRLESINAHLGMASLACLQQGERGPSWSLVCIPRNLLRCPVQRRLLAHMFVRGDSSRAMQDRAQHRRRQHVRCAQICCQRQCL
jgi:hypothetical protein